MATRLGIYTGINMKNVIILHGSCDKEEYYSDDFLVVMFTGYTLSCKEFSCQLLPLNGIDAEELELVFHIPLHVNGIFRMSILGEEFLQGNYIRAHRISQIESSDILFSFEDRQNRIGRSPAICPEQACRAR